MMSPSKNDVVFVHTIQKHLGSKKMLKENCKTFVTIARRMVIRLNKDCTKKGCKNWRTWQKTLCIEKWTWK